MTTQAKLEANRRNAKLARGPRTTAGLARSSQNARTHGLLAAAVLVPHVERAEDWKAHREAVLGDLAPKGAIEQALAERVAGLLWRLRRVERYETAILAEEQNGAEAEAVKDLRHEQEMRDITAGERTAVLLPADVQEARDHVANERAIERLCAELASLADDAELDHEAAIGAAYAIETVATEAAKEAGKAFDFDEVDIPGWPDDVSLDEATWTAGLLRATAQATAEACGMTADELVSAAGQHARFEGFMAEHHLSKLEAELERRRGRGLMLGEDKADKVARYEGHLERSLYRALHELQRCQAERGARGSAPAMLDVDVSVGQRLDA